MDVETNGGFGAYGLRIAALPGARPWMQPQPHGAPSLRLRVTVTDDPDDSPSRYDERSADIRLLTGGRLRVWREPGAAHYLLPEVPDDADLLHPFVAPAAALLWRWAGREAIHAGAFVGEAGAIMVLADKGGGKSTTLARLAEAGVPVLSDDLVVVEAGHALAGPRSIDLRPAAPAPVGASPVRLVRGGERRRVSLPTVPNRLPLAGLVALEWGERLEVAAVPVEERWALISQQRSFPALPADPVSLLDVVTVPAFRVSRPPDVSSLDATAAAIRDTFA